MNRTKGRSTSLVPEVSCARFRMNRNDLPLALSQLLLLGNRPLQYILRETLFDKWKIV